ncbi:GNAT family N-acetyltransferase [Aquamicrobium sp. NLF2-7]|uniref:GNAT family N-acetyltransferase n=1 Tax=Aquamicrobium sp. NLF2-7 TaxID=2918753 RepID=UPI001EFA5843|nr:GNAT family N-acetyltransferase [Aquamicrobium sp. NLF2-7]MCG8270528.1 GNAT family N-acetyltransferase [Aquamicrobium sp. NLF2-7]
MDQGNDQANSKTTGHVVRVAGGMDGFTRGEWNSLSDSHKTSGNNYNPFISYDFLTTLEESGCVGGRSGWQPHHLKLESAEGVLVGAIPCYAKSHSQGEYVFDQGWADAFERAGGRYYPKLQSAVPFTPATGPRLLVAGGCDPLTVKAGLAEALRMVTDRLGVSSAHVSFLPQDDVALMEAAGFLHRTDQQFHFFNDGFSGYDDFLATLASRKRKALKKERREALADGISIDWLTGRDLTERVWDDFFTFYIDTGSRKWGRPYLNRQFFSLIGERMADDILLVMAKRNDRYVAGAINFIGSDTLFGRNWGCVEDHPFLHFEVCYHQAIDFAIANKIRVVEAGAQGEHKLARGYQPVTTHSMHYIANPSFRRAVADYLRRERQEVKLMGDYLAEHTPFRKDDQ